MRHRFPSRFAVALSVALLAGYAPVAQAVDGVRLINQEMALSGNVTPGDTPGFPVWIFQPGSYRLSGNLRLDMPNRAVIAIFADNVTLGRDGMDTLANNPEWGVEANARRYVADMIEEYARHTGHADLLREQVDGATGEGAPQDFPVP